MHFGKAIECIHLKIGCRFNGVTSYQQAKSTKFRVNSSFLNPMAVDPFFLGCRGSRIGAVLILNGQMNLYIHF